MKQCILLTGNAGTGKDTVAAYLVSKYGYKKLAFADALKKVSIILFNLPNDVEYYNNRKRKEKKIKNCKYSPREMWQILGEQMRNVFYQEIWIDNVLSKCNNIDKIVISDCRYDNESIQVKKRIKNAKLWKIVRPKFTGDVGLTNGKEKHASERGLTVKEDCLLVNNGSKKNLYKEIDKLMQ